MNKVLIWVLFLPLFFGSCNAEVKSNKTTADKALDDVEKVSVQDSLSQLMTFFRKPNTAIPEEFVINFLDVEYYGEFHNGCYSDSAFEVNDLTFFIVRLTCVAGAICESKQLYIIKDGSIKSNLRVGNLGGDQSLKLETNYRFINDMLIELATRRKEYEIDYESDDDEDPVLVMDSTFFEYYLVKETAEIGKISNSISSLREFPHTSYKVIDNDQLETYSKDDLDIMRNEIFASYGYQFETAKWKDYFGSKSWYDPNTKDVDDLLSPIELENIQRILTVSKDK